MRRHKFLVFLSLGVMLAFAVISAQAQTQAPTFTTIDVPGAVETNVNDINTNGVMVGFSCSADLCVNGAPSTAFALVNGTFKSLRPPGATSSLAYGINDSNAIVGWFVDAGGITHGFMFKTGHYSQIDPPGSSFTNAWDINNSGTIVGTYVGTDGLFHGFTLIGTTYTTFDAPNGSTLTELTGVNNNGAMVGIYFDASSVQHGFSLNGTTFKSIDVPGSQLTAADRINDTNVIVGLFGTNGSNPPFQGWRRSGTTYTHINFPGSSETRCRGINNAGVIVGRYSDTAGTTIHGMMVTP